MDESEHENTKSEEEVKNDKDSAQGTMMDGLGSELLDWLKGYPRC